MILDLLFAGSGNKAGPFALIAIALVLVVGIPVTLLSKGCGGPKAPKPTLEQLQIEHIKAALGGAGQVTITQAHPPVGPWTLVNPSSRYYRAVVGPTARPIWVEVHVSTGWTVAAVVAGGKGPVYGYRYQGETKLLGKTFYPTIDR